jgi:hypothetical protein
MSAEGNRKYRVNPNVAEPISLSINLDFMIRDIKATYLGLGKSVEQLLPDTM